MRWGWGWEWDERENPERREFYSNSKTKVSKNLFTTNYLINLNLNLKSGKNRPKKWQIIWKKFSTKTKLSERNFQQNYLKVKIFSPSFGSYLNSDLKVRNRNYLKVKIFFTKFS